MTPNGPIDPLAGPAFALEGRVVTMDGGNVVHDDARVYVRDASIEAVIPAGQDVPPELHDIDVVETQGTIYPGLIELHNHLSYDVLPLWMVTQPFTNRSKWSQGDTYRKLVTGPMTVLGRLREFVPPVVRYVEAKCLLGGTTTSQGVALFSFGGITRFYQGIVRNVERTLDPDLPNAGTRIADVDATDVGSFVLRLDQFADACLLLHLAEGTDDPAHDHFTSLHVKDDEWAITRALGGIHCVALKPEDFDVLAANDGSMVWSPLSNLLLYTKTADVAAAKASGVRMALGSDWSYSGSKNLLGELKVARLVSQDLGGLFTDQELVAMATRNAADVLQWPALGSIEVGNRADLLVVAGDSGDPYGHLIEATEKDVALVVINGTARYGRSTFVDLLGGSAEDLMVGGISMKANLAQATADPAVGAITIAQAADTLTDAMQDLPAQAKRLEVMPVASLLSAVDPNAFYLSLDHDEQPGLALRPHLPGPDGLPTAEIPASPLVAAAAPLSQVLGPVRLDPLTVVDDDEFLQAISNEMNLPASVKTGLPALY